MGPPGARQRYNANRLGRTSKKLASSNTKSNIQKLVVKRGTIAMVTDKMNVMPSVNTAFKTLVSARLFSAIWAQINDCDETFNYWEPLHYIIYGQGLQTWEYSPQFALRSYTYLLLQGVPGWIYEKIFHPSPVLIFYMIRCILAFGCSVMERFMYKSICQEFGIHIGRMWLIFQLFSVGMFISSASLLPSSFAMVFGCSALAAWWQQKQALAIFFMAIASLLGWPFAALIGVPITIDMLLRQRIIRTFTIWFIISAATIGLPMLFIDSYYYGKWTLAPINIILYNVFTSHGPNIFGTEPLSYYLVNCFLNFNIIWFLSLITPCLLILDYFIVPAKSRSTLYFPLYVTLSPFYLWLLVFFTQAHKEERFLFPIYPLITLCGAISVDVCQRVFYRLSIAFNRKIRIIGSHYLDHTMFISIIVIILSTLLSLSRLFALHRNYGAPIDLMMEFNQFKNSEEYNTECLYNVCISKDWYRYPSSFFLPARNFRLRFLKSEFRGLLPAYYTNELNATRIEHTYFNNLNQENNFMYFPYDYCSFLIDFDENKYTELEPAYSKRFEDWITLKSLPMLILDRSKRFYRSYYIPFISDYYNTYGNFNLLKRKTMKCR